MRVCCITNDLEATSIYGEPYRKDIAENVLNEALPAVLALYRKYNVKATFYCLASYVEDYPELVRLIEADGHEIASHGLIHNSDKAFDLLKKDGVLSIITFHSLEDRMVKLRFKEYCTGCTCPPDFPVCVCGKTPKGHLLTRKPIEPGEKELKNNPRSRSAKLRVIIKN